MKYPNIQFTRYSSPWSIWDRLRQLLWELVWCLLCVWTPKPFNIWRLYILRCFGATLFGRPFVHQRSRIDHPWNLTLHNRSCLGDRAHIYCLSKVDICTGACVAQEAYICTGSHDFNNPVWPLRTASIHVGSNAFIGARAFLLPGVKIGDSAIVGACSVVTRNVLPKTTVAGNPARTITPSDC